MAGAEGPGDVPTPSDGVGEGTRFAGIPDLETVLAEAGAEEIQPPTTDEIAPPPVTDRDGKLLFDPDDKDPLR
jgi:hypothetical protein